MTIEETIQTNTTHDEVDGPKKWENLKPEDLLRGSDLSDVEQRCLKLCSEYIGGAWSSATDPAKDITVKRIAGGLTNQLYYVGLADHVTGENNKSVYPDEPREVAIKFYQAKHFKTVGGNDERLSDTIIGLLTSQLDIGPKVYGIFDDGIIQGYYKHVQFKVKQQQNDKLLRQLMHKLAKIHLLEVPIAKQTKWFLDNMQNQLKSAYDDLDIRNKIIEYNLETMKKHDPLKEMENYRKLIESSPSPLVFTHHDFRGANIMVTGSEESQQLVICDYEYGSYDLRGFDFGNILFEWNHNGNELDIESWLKWQMPARDVLEKIAGLYLEGCDLVRPGYSSQPGNSIENVIRDAKLGTMQSAMFGFVFMLNLRESLIDSIEFDLKANLKMAEISYQFYWKIKQQLIEEGIIFK